MTRINCNGKSVRLFSCLIGLTICAPAIAEKISFEGPFVGLSIGYGESSVKEEKALWSQVGNIDFIGSGGENSKGRGAMGGMNLGYDWRFNDFTVGVDVSGELTDARSNGTLLSFDETFGGPSDHVASSTKLKSIITIKPKLGLVLDDQTRIYAMAGFATARVSRTVTGLTGTTGDVFLDAGVTGSDSKRMSGYTAGVGAERVIGSGFSLTLELNYFDFGHEDFTYGGTTFGTASTMVQSVKVTYSAATLGVVYRF
jgi:opacity protein-like surface antigen